MQWPPSRPDMNIMKFIRAHVMRELSYNPPTTFRKLRVRVHHIWNEIPQDTGTPV